METKPQTMKNEQLLNLAKMKSEHLTANSMIRLTAENNSLWLYNFGGFIFVGYQIEEPATLLFDKKEIYNISDKSGKITAVVQRLY